MGGNSDNQVITDNFENYRSDRQIASAYQPWQDGAFLMTSLETEEVFSGNHALRIDVIGPNKKNQSAIGSIYHHLPGGQRNWSSGTAVRFWVHNPSPEPLLLTVNFKETYNEYWAVNSEGIFFLESTAGELRKVALDYGNLPIPGKYSGFVVIPFSSFSVPEWNTARGNESMDLNHIDTFSFGLTTNANHPFHFFLDDFEIIAVQPFRYLEIYRDDSFLFIPDERDLTINLNAYLVDPENHKSTPVKPDCHIIPQVTNIQIDQNGRLTIPSGITENEFMITCEFRDEERKYIDEIKISLVSSGNSAADLSEMQLQASPENEGGMTAGNLRLSPFETWAYQKRPLFVFLSTSIVLILVILLSAFQKRI